MTPARGEAGGHLGTWGSQETPAPKPSLGGRPAWRWGAGGRGRAGAGPCLRHPARSPNMPDLKRRFPAGRCGRAVPPHRRDSPHPGPPLPDPPPRTGLGRGGDGTERGGHGTRPSGAAQQSRVVWASPPRRRGHSIPAPRPPPRSGPPGLRSLRAVGPGRRSAPWDRPVPDVGTRWGSWLRAETLGWCCGGSWGSATPSIPRPSSPRHVRGPRRKPIGSPSEVFGSR